MEWKPRELLKKIDVMARSSQLCLRRYRVPVRLGWTRAERARSQPVELSLKVYFNQWPRACQSDLLEDTIDYQKICSKIQQELEKKEFRLIEHLVHRVSVVLRSVFQMHAAHIDKLEIKVHKVQVPIAGLRGGAVFTLVEASKP